MRINRKTPLLWIICSIAMLALFSACDPFGYLTYENHAEVPIGVHLKEVAPSDPGPYVFRTDGYYWGPVSPGNQERFGYAGYALIDEDVGKRSNFLITAIDNDRNLIYQRTFTWYELQDADWEVVIEPMPVDLSILGEVTYENRTGLPIRAYLIHVELDYEHDRPRYQDAGGEISVNETSSFSYYGLAFQDSEMGSQYKYLVTSVEDKDPGEDVNLLYQRIFTWDELNDADWHVVIDPALSD
jgi:hypothetical protein